MKLRSLGILVIAAVLLNCNSVKALKGTTDSGESISASQCSAGWCISNGNYGVRISIVDRNGNVKGKALNIMIQLSNIDVEQINTINRFPGAKNGYEVNEYYINNSELGVVKDLLKNLIIMQDKNNNYTSKGGVDSKIKEWQSGDNTFKKIQELTGANVSASDYLVVEPLTVTYKYGEKKYYYGTAREIVAKIEETSSLNYGSRVFVLERAGKAMISTLHKITIPNTADDQGDRLVTFKQDKNTLPDVNKNKKYWNNYTYGVAIYSLEKIVNQCKIGVNNNYDSKYNWIQYDAEQEKYIPVEKGCCSSYETAGISREEVFAHYPQCFTDKDIDIMCFRTNESSQECSTNGGYSSIDNKPKILDACLASNKYQAGIIDSEAKVFYGCYYTDRLSFPKQYRHNLPLGGHFVWPTDDTLLKFGLNDLSYDLSRVSTAECFAYQVDNNSGLFKAYRNLNQKQLDKIKNKVQELIKTEKEKMELKQNGETVGELKYDVTNNEGTSSNNGYFKINISGIYRQVSDSPNAYRYYDNENLKYLQNNKVNKNRLTSYTAYPYMLLPIDRNWRLDDSYKYGFEYNTNFASLEMGATYTCESKVTDKPASTCICPSGTENVGLDLTNYYVATKHGTCNDVGKTTICSILIDEYCNNQNLPDLKCPNRNKDLSSCVHQKLNADSNLSQMSAYNQCVYEECNCTGSNCDYKELCPLCDQGESCPPQGKLDIIYRPIFLDNPFPSINGNIRYPGANWGGKNSLTANKSYQGLVEKYITSTEKYMYQGEPMYSITLTPKTIKSIKNYNHNHKYDDFRLECDNGGKCYSTFLHKELPSYDNNVINGTCGIINYKNKYYNEFEKCRLDSFSK